jgi:N-acetylmuramoyl-L-alanine amidase
MSLAISADGIIQPPSVKQLMITAKNKATFATPPDTIIIHYTAGSSAVSSANWLSRPDVQASAHVVIGKEGEIYQIVPFTHIAWHAGESAYGGRKSFNNFSIGIELDNPGYVTRAGSEYVAPFGTKYPPNEVIEAVHRNEKAPRFWHIYTEAQISACEELCLALMSTYPTINQILGHEEIAPGRKQDPGPAFPLEKFRAKLLQNNRESDADEIKPAFSEGKVISDKLNIREGAGVNFDKVAKPLPLNKKVIVLGERNGWYRVKVEVEGWVSKAFVSKP